MKTEQDWQFSPATEDEEWPRLKRLARWLLLLLIPCLMVVFAAPLSSLYLDVPGLSGFRVMMFAMLAGLILVSAAIVLFIYSLFIDCRVVRNRALLTLSLGITPAAIAILLIGPQNLASPMIHDISTDTAEPPQFQQAAALRAPGDNPLDYGGNAIAVLQQQAYPDLGPITTDLSPTDALSEAIQVTKDLRWEFINIDYEQGIIEAYDTSKVFGFVDDVVIRVRPQGRGSHVDIRSVSRVGKGDLGKNAERIRRFIRSFRG